MSGHPELSGFSGASLQVHRAGGRTWIRKMAATPEGNERLRRQAAKQLAYSRRVYSIRTPTIINEGEREGLYYFDMDFVMGRGGHQVLETGTFAELARFTDQVVRLLAETAGEPPLADCPYGSWFDASINKLLDIQERTRAIPEALFGRLVGDLAGLRRLPPMKPGFCHGDLTLENIMMDQAGHIWLVDFLDSPFEHPWQDYIKLEQDTRAEWFRIKGRRISAAVTEYLHSQLMTAIGRLSPDYVRFQRALLGINLCRILPYVRTAEEREFLMVRINHFSCEP